MLIGLVTGLASFVPVPAVLASTHGVDQAAEQTAGAVSRWDFRVFLNDREVGYHEFTVTRDGDARRVESEASFQVKFLLFNAYEYQHEAQESWRDGCLRRIRARTNDNGEVYTVRGRSRDDYFLIERDSNAEKLPGCIQTFAYWNLDFLDSGRLLNPQTGEYVEVALSPLGPDTVTIGSREVAAQAYRLMADGRRIDLWYRADNQEWLALEAQTGDDRVLRYEPAPGQGQALGGAAGEDARAGNDDS